MLITEQNRTGELITCKKWITEFNLLFLKHVDDSTVAESVDMKNQLVNIPG